MTQAIIDARGQNEIYSGQILELIYFIDRPFLQHLVEYLAGLGYSEMLILISKDSIRVRKLLGDGTRWGITIDYRLVKNDAALDSIVDQDMDKERLLVQAEEILFIDALAKCATKYCIDGRICWTSIPQGQSINELDDDCVENMAPGSYLDISTINNFLNTQRQFLTKKSGRLLLGAHASDDGVWISRNNSIHPTVSIHPPVYIGEDCILHQGACIGPNVVLGNNCVVSSDTNIENSLICPNSFIGQKLNVQDSIVQKNLLVNLKHDSSLVVEDDFLISEIRAPVWPHVIFSCISRLCALFLFISLLPVFVFNCLILLCRTGSLIKTSEKVRIPQTDFSQRKFFKHYSFRDGDHKKNCDPIYHFFCHFIPGLINVIKGDMLIVGLQSLSPEVYEEMSSDRQKLYLSSHAGLITELDILPRGYDDEDLAYASEVFYSVRIEWRYHLKISSQYALKFCHIN
ncbi:MAG: hypothetical protein HRT89_01830 [Lentisphaeria bacterium]|nr:hypothetical protein [Lentisphaeria bacterium]NQZ66786.1 hypothetical protein [Lentisphaeria bacterium]